MHGCPYGLIYDAAATLAELRGRGLHYVSGCVVDRLVEGPQGVTVIGRSLASGEAVRFEAERVYVGCGAVATTRLLLASLEAFDRPVLMQDSQYFLLPLLRWRGVPAPRREALHTLAQLFLELRPPAVGPRNVHLQVYGYSDLFEALFDRLLGPVARVVRPAVDALLSRMLVIQGYLHSELSPSMRVWLRRDGEIGSWCWRRSATRSRGRPCVVSRAFCCATRRICAPCPSHRCSRSHRRAGAFTAAARSRCVRRHRLSRAICWADRTASRASTRSTRRCSPRSRRPPSPSP
jgi:hypothetical protein